MQPSLAELTLRYLKQPQVATSAEVEAYDVASAFRVEPQAAWSETLQVLKAFVNCGALPKMPVEWLDLVKDAVPAKWIPMAFGYYPQQVSEFTKLMHDGAPSIPQVPVRIQSVLRDSARDNPDATLNEKAAEAFRVGKTDIAIANWRLMSESSIKTFNLGMALLAANQPDEAKSQLATAISKLPQNSGWRSLAELYSALAESDISTLGSKS